MDTSQTRSPLLQAIFNRRSLRRYTQESVPHALITTILEAGRWAPSAHNRQPWRFAVIESQGAKQSLARAMGSRLQQDLEADGVPQEVITKDVDRSYDRLTSAPVLVVLFLSMQDMDTYPDHSRMTNEYIMAVQSVAMAGQNMLLAAHDAGLGACWMCAPLFCPDVVRNTLNLPDDWQAQGVLTLGYPAQARHKARKQLADHVAWY